METQKFSQVSLSGMFLCFHMIVLDTGISKLTLTLPLECTFPLTGPRCVSRIITELGVFDVDFTKGLTLVEIANGVSLEEVRTKTSAPFSVAKDLKEIL
jgi:acyl CoA:acetate/3-ketoacid CoA transferase beta subunit